MDTFSDVQLAASLRARGYGYGELARQAASGRLIRIRRGAYANTPTSDPIEQHRRLIAATLPRLGPDAVVSHGSAALLHDLPTWPDELQRVHLSRPGTTGGRRGNVTHVHVTPLPSADITTLAGIQVTDLARTVADVARTSTYERAVIVGDAALQAGLSKPDLLDLLAGSPRRVGDPQARRVAGFIEIGAESAGESVSRIVLSRMGLPAPTLQYRVVDPSTGGTVARVDFGWEELRTVGEFDGKVKYEKYLEPGRTAGDVLFAEKVREDMLRDLGWEVVRWIWADLRRPEVIADRLRRAFARAAHRR